MKNLLFLCAGLLSVVSCATEPTTTATSSKQTLANLENIKIGQPRAEAERVLGNPTSITDTAMGSTAVWVFSSGASTTAPPPDPQSNSRLYSQIGSIAATTAGIFVPYAGMAGSIGSQVYNISNSGDGNTALPIQAVGDNTRIVTIKFIDNKVFSIQRTRPTTAPPPSSNQ
jgi:hypothetical protein